MIYEKNRSLIMKVEWINNKSGFEENKTEFFLSELKGK